MRSHLGALLDGYARVLIENDHLMRLTQSRLDAPGDEADPPGSP